MDRVSYPTLLYAPTTEILTCYTSLSFMNVLEIESYRGKRIDKPTTSHVVGCIALITTIIIIIIIILLLVLVLLIRYSTSDKFIKVFR